MKIQTKTRMALVEASNPTELMFKFNEMMDGVEHFSHKEPVIDLPNLTAYVIYTQQEVVIEGREDMHELKGEKFYCSDCSHFHDNKLPNGTSDCPYRHGACHGWDRVCREFWDAYEAGEDILYVPRNKDGSANKTTTKGKRYLELQKKGVVR